MAVRAPAIFEQTPTMPHPKLGMALADQECDVPCTITVSVADPKILHPTLDSNPKPHTLETLTTNPQPEPTTGA